ncbi:TetR/AcrR family transcriptional regulator [Asanoa siamensis]|uniref:TetR family transcriptional regulator n=1 Tax=Asanoa siamensis TaxID=926357 RepID=A0ABQ4CQ53_9ACTN|nr:TetR/AcrR family transcriptional regulator [Asanoa siamensis]GIF72982.1 TetR family transcriptional regulator [Asanoa siamensis]
MRATSQDTAGGVRRTRNAAQTREALLQVASRRFARDGYASTTVREIADEAGVNVALISRYFASKEGLFEACLAAAVTDLRRDAGDTSLEAIAPSIARRMVGATSDGGRLPDTLLLLLRSSGDEHVDNVRREFLQSLSERMAAASPAGPETLLRAQILLATTLGMALLRTSMSIQPLAAATEQDLLGPVSDLVDALLAEKR